LGLQSSSLFARSRYPLRGFPFLVNADVIGLNKIDGLDFTEPDTLWVAVAKVALEDPTVDGIKTHCTEGANADTGTAADTGIIVNGYPTRLLLL